MKRGNLKELACDWVFWRDLSTVEMVWETRCHQTWPKQTSTLKRPSRFLQHHFRTTRKRPIGSRLCCHRPHHQRHLCFSSQPLLLSQLLNLHWDCQRQIRSSHENYMKHSVWRRAHFWLQFCHWKLAGVWWGYLFMRNLLLRRLIFTAVK